MDNEATALIVSEIQLRQHIQESGGLRRPEVVLERHGSARLPGVLEGLNKGLVPLF
jgi:hypothetical protein